MFAAERSIFALTVSLKGESKKERVYDLILTVALTSKLTRRNPLYFALIGWVCLRLITTTITLLI